MKPPDQRLFEADLETVGFRNGVVNGWWGEADPDVCPPGHTWPKVIFWIMPAPRPNAPDRYYLSLDCEGYREVPPTGTFWDPARKQNLDVVNRPKGKPNSRFEKVFRMDAWVHAGIAFYHPYDRVAIVGHDAWKQQQPHLVWDASHTIVDYLEEFWALLNSEGYIGV